MPTTLPTATRGNMSDVVVNRLADQPWCAAIARLRMATTPTCWSGVGHVKHRKHAQRADQHGRLAGRIDGPSAVDQVRRKPAAGDTAHCRTRCRTTSMRMRQSLAISGKVIRFLKILGQPEKVKPPDGVREELAECRTPRFPSWENTRRHGTAHDLVRRIALDQRELLRRYLGVLLGLPVEQQPRCQPDEADGAGDQERRLPAPFRRHPGHQQNRGHRARCWSRN